MSARHVVVRHIERPDAAVVAGLSDAGAATVHEVMGRVGCLEPAIRPIQPGARVAGPAVTVLSQAGDNLMVLAAVEVCEPGDVVVIATTSRSTDGMCGELVATSFQAHGVAGLVCDAGVRDVAEIRQLGLAVWSRAISPQGTVKASAGSVNVPVVCGGVLVEPGDVVVADDDGVVVVPRREAAEVLERATARLDKEAGTRAALADGVLGIDHYGLRPTIERLGVVYLDDLDEAPGV